MWNVRVKLTLHHQRLPLKWNILEKDLVFVYKIQQWIDASCHTRPIHIKLQLWHIAEHKHIKSPLLSEFSSYLVALSQRAVVYMKTEWGSCLKLLIYPVFYLPIQFEPKKTKFFPFFTLWLRTTKFICGKMLMLESLYLDTEWEGKRLGFPF